jgi:hypothetical protein
MDKLVEREAAARNPLSSAPAIAVQFFLIPLLVVGATVLVYVGFRSLLSEGRTAEEYLTDIRSCEARPRTDQGLRGVWKRRSKG